MTTGALRPSALALTTLLIACSAEKEPSDTSASAPFEAGPYLRDAQGRVLLHRGINLNNQA